MEELHKTHVSSGALRVEIDDPPDHCFRTPAGILRGWLATLDQELPERFLFEVGEITLPHQLVRREDVAEVLQDHTIVGFEIRYDLCGYLPYIERARLVIRLKIPDHDPLLFRFKIPESVLAACLASAGGV
jgi:hypothetical protein